MSSLYSGGIFLSKDNDNVATFGSLLISAVKGALVGVLVTLVLSFLFSALALAIPDPDAALGVLAYVSLALASLFVGICCIKCDGERRVFASLVGGGMYALILFTVSLFMRTDNSPSLILSLLVYLACIGIAAVGGALGKPKRARIGEGKNSRAASIRRKLGAKK